MNWSFIGYNTETRTLTLNADQTLDIELAPNVIAVGAAEVEAERSANTEIYRPRQSQSRGGNHQKSPGTAR